jgi:hypothetical protein
MDAEIEIGDIVKHKGNDDCAVVTAIENNDNDNGEPIFTIDHGSRGIRNIGLEALTTAYRLM